jgi:hypothetical protein
VSLLVRPVRARVHAKAINVCRIADLNCNPAQAAIQLLRLPEKNGRHARSGSLYSGPFSHLLEMKLQPNGTLFSVQV